MGTPNTFSLDAIRTDGWFERVGQTVASFQALCDIVGERFLAFSMITGARITALTVDRHNPQETVVDFVKAEGADPNTGEPRRLTLAEFRRSLVQSLVSDEPKGPAPTNPDDAESIQHHIGIGFLLLAPLYGYSLSALEIDGDKSELVLTHDGAEQRRELSQFRQQIRMHVRRELENVAKPPRTRGGIDVAAYEEAKRAVAAGDQLKVVELLGGWPAPLTVFLRTAEGQLLNPKARSMIAQALGLLGTAHALLGDTGKSEEVLRLAIQYAGDSDVAGDVYGRLGATLYAEHRFGEAIGLLRRAANLGATGPMLWESLSHSLLHRGRLLAAYAAALEGVQFGLSKESLLKIEREARAKLGDGFDQLRQAANPG
ncbi:MAG TPA: tetratricopeptide repeat protein [Polyangiaceae bacterium]|nr:tetratricopeptide repeat protein [Polyangiaceae bacterium]